MKLYRKLNLPLVFPILPLLVLLQFCAPTAKVKNKSPYYEDLSVHRNEYRVEENAQTVLYEQPVSEESAKNLNHIGQELDSVTNIMLETKRNINYVDGFTIQIYSGNSREKANRAKARVYNLLETMKPMVSYDQPNYKVKVGKYFSMLEANSDFSVLKDSFSRAVLVPTKIKLTRE